MRGHAVRPQPDEHPLLQHLQHGRDPDRVVHVGLGTVDHHRVGAGDNVDIRSIEMHSVHEDGFRPGDPGRGKALEDAHAVALPRQGHVRRVLGHVDMTTHVP